jgi:ABC-type cobalamin/Fe3+-siderophores transport system ATPase subunit
VLIILRKITFIIGPTGSGKSTLVRALLDKSIKNSVDIIKIDNEDLYNFEDDLNNYIIDDADIEDVVKFIDLKYTDICLDKIKINVFYLECFSNVIISRTTNRIVDYNTIEEDIDRYSLIVSNLFMQDVPIDEIVNFVRVNNDGDAEIVHIVSQLYNFII